MCNEKQHTQNIILFIESVQNRQPYRLETRLVVVLHQVGESLGEIRNDSLRV